jgi:hypothetical protein
MRLSLHATSCIDGSFGAMTRRFQEGLIKTVKCFSQLSQSRAGIQTRDHPITNSGNQETVSLNHIHFFDLVFQRSRVSSGSLVSDYGLDNRAIGVLSPAGAEDFSSILCVQTGSGAHPASCTMGTGGPFPGVKRGRGVMLTTHPI